VNLGVDVAGIPARHACAAGEMEVATSLNAVSVPYHRAWEGGSQSCRRWEQHCGSGTSLVTPHHCHAYIAEQPNQMRYVTAVDEGKVECGVDLVDAGEELMGL
jgi:hypothetical protein